MKLNLTIFSTLIACILCMAWMNASLAKEIYHLETNDFRISMEEIERIIAPPIPKQKPR